MSVGMDDVPKFCLSERVSGSISEIVLSSASTTQTLPSPTATAAGAVPRGTLATSSPEEGSSASAPDASIVSPPRVPW